MPNKVKNTLLESMPQYDKYPMKVTKGREPDMPPTAIESGGEKYRMQKIEVMAGDCVMVVAK
jgi:hypothetical protein